MTSTAKHSAARLRPTVFALTLATAVGFGCGDGTGSGTATLRVQITDAPADLLASAVVQIGVVELLPTDGPGVMLTDDGGEHDLLTLQDGVTADLADLEIEAGRYRQVRLVVTSATVTLKDDYQFNDGTQTQTLQVPSGAQSGIKINLDDGSGEAGIDISSGETILVIDFDVAQNFRVQGNPNTPAGINGILFTPLLRAVVRDVAGAISGTVTASAGQAIEGLTVTAEQTDSGALESLQTQTVTAVTDSQGQYTLMFVAPGTYAVSVDDTTTDPATQTVTVDEGESVTGVDFSIAN